jgi:hypothetical protein
MVFASLILLFGAYAYTVFNGTPWGKKQQETQMREYLVDKYQVDFELSNIDFNYLSETYQGYAFPKGHADYVFLIEEDLEASGGYSENYQKVIWDSELAEHIKAKMLELFPALDERTFKVLQIKDKGEILGSDIPTYGDANVSFLESSITIDINGAWEEQDQKIEKERMNELSLFLKENHFPILVEVRYFKEEMNENAKVFFIKEDGSITEK